MLAAQQIAKRLAQQKEELRLGGLIHLKGDQIVFKPLVELNRRLKIARDNPTAHNIKMAKQAYNNGAMAVAVQNEQFKTAKRRRLEKQHKKKLKTIRTEKDKKEHGVKHLAHLIREEKKRKAAAKERIRKHFAAGKEREAKKWKTARNKVKTAREKLVKSEKNAKHRFNSEVNKKAREKAWKAPMENLAKAKTVLKERGQKLGKAKPGSAKFIAKTMRERALKRMNERAAKARVHPSARRRRVNIRRRRAPAAVSNSLIKMRHGHCLDAAQRNRAGGKLHLWSCNARNWNQQWNYNSATGLIKNSHGLCIDAAQRNRNGGLVRTWGCNANNHNQQWSYNHGTGQIKSKHGICLDSPQRNRAGGLVRMWSCNTRSANQQWGIQKFRL